MRKFFAGHQNANYLACGRLPPFKRKRSLLNAQPGKGVSQAVRVALLGKPKVDFHFEPTPGGGGLMALAAEAQARAEIKKDRAGGNQNFSKVGAGLSARLPQPGNVFCGRIKLQLCSGERKRHAKHGEVAICVP